MNIIIMFTVLSIVNVIFSTIRSILTIKGGKVIASLTSGGYFAFYNIMLIYTVADFEMWQKCLITFGCNVIGVFIVKLIEEKMRKDKMWLVKITIPTKNVENVSKALTLNKIPFSEIELSNSDYVAFDTFCLNSKQTKTVLKICEIYEGKSFATETKL